MDRPLVPPGRELALPHRGTTFVREAAGPPGALTVMLLHGLGASVALNWPGAFEALSPYFRVVALDQRGHGRGVRSLRPFRLQDCADDAVALADALGIERFIPAGYSMGGPITLYVARRHPGRVQGMVLCATSATFEGANPAGLVMTDALAVGLRFTPPRLRAQMAERMVRTSANRGPLSPAIAEEVRRHDPAAIAEAVNAVRRFDGRRWVGGLQAPAAVVVTTADHMVPPARQRELARLTGAPVFEVGADHDVAMRAPNVFLPVLVSACRSVAASATAGPAPASR